MMFDEWILDTAKKPTGIQQKRNKIDYDIEIYSFNRGDFFRLFVFWNLKVQALPV